jgi:hypothetical protein
MRMSYERDVQLLFRHFFCLLTLATATLLGKLPYTYFNNPNHYPSTISLLVYVHKLEPSALPSFPKTQEVQKQYSEAMRSLYHTAMKHNSDFYSVTNISTGLDPICTRILTPCSQKPLQSSRTVPTIEQTTLTLNRLPHCNKINHSQPECLNRSPS